jgi:hypothetical protein
MGQGQHWRLCVWWTVAIDYGTDCTYTVNDCGPRSSRHMCYSSAVNPIYCRGGRPQFKLRIIAAVLVRTNLPRCSTIFKQHPSTPTIPSFAFSLGRIDRSVNVSTSACVKMFAGSKRLVARATRQVAATTTQRLSKQPPLQLGGTNPRFLWSNLANWNGDDVKKQRSLSALYVDTMPRVVMDPKDRNDLPKLGWAHMKTVRSWHSTGTMSATGSATTTGSSKRDAGLESESATTHASSSSSSSSPNSTPPTPPPTATTMRQKLRTTLRDGVDELRDSAATQLREFREHPRQSATQGAKTVSAMFKKYGPVFIGTYASLYFTFLGTLFVGINSGALDPVVLFSWLGQSGGSQETTASTVQLVVDFMNNHDFTKPYSGMIEKHPAFANLAVAWIAIKFTEPVRLALALTLTPSVSRFLGYTKEEETSSSLRGGDEPLSRDSESTDAPSSKNPKL